MIDHFDDEMARICAGQKVVTSRQKLTPILHILAK